MLRDALLQQGAPGRSQVKPLKATRRLRRTAPRGSEMRSSEHSGPWRGERAEWGRTGRVWNGAPARACVESIPRRRAFIRRHRESPDRTPGTPFQEPRGVFSSSASAWGSSSGSPPPPSHTPTSPVSPESLGMPFQASDPTSYSCSADPRPRSGTSIGPPAPSRTPTPDGEGGA